MKSVKDEVADLDELIDNIFDSFLPSKRKNMAFIRPQKVFSPATDVYETESELVIKLEIAGINPDAVVVSVSKDYVIIRGVRKDIHTRHIRKCSYHLAEINYGVFERHLPLYIPVNEQLAKATYQQGFLIISLPRQGSSKVKQVTIESEE
ncbi:MAG: Hsp20/alpha crystallin family protein [bacterium]|nr:Hsp20/alpha crystallin family protein [bacterium]